MIAHFVFINLPSPQTLTNRDIQGSTKIYDRNGILLYKIYKDQNRTLVAIEQIPLHVRLASLAAEDADFYSHHGFSIKGILRALFKIIKEKKVTGGSTITQQLVKVTLLTPEKTLIRKLREVVLSIQVEALYSKDKILEMYLNEVSYGNLAYGIEEASQVYFGKSTNKLTLAQGALLAGLPKSPTLFSPFGPDPALAKNRQEEILNLMVEKGFVAFDLAQDAKKEELEFIKIKNEIKAPHFVMYIRQLLVEKYGEEMVEKGGLEVTTTLDYSIQQQAEKIIQQEVDKLKKLRVTNGAALVIDPKTWQILAMVGSKDYFDQNIDGNVNVTLQPRSPGSAIKAVTYSYALSHGMTPATVITDAPAVFPLPNQPPYIPKNYDNTFKGNLTLRNAFAQSRNIPAVKTVMQFGVLEILKHGNKLGIESWQDPSRYGPSITLGGGEVKLIELASVYTTLANMGVKQNFSPIISVKRQNIEQWFNKKMPVKIIDPRVAYMIIDILKDNIARSPAFGSYSNLVIPKHPEVAVKTGTSNDLRDNLTVGFNQNYLVAVWVGNNDNSPMSRIASGVTGASPIWNKIISTLVANNESREWQIPDGLVKNKDCFGKSEWFLKENQNKGPCPTKTQDASPTPSPTIFFYRR